MKTNYVGKLLVLFASRYNKNEILSLIGDESRLIHDPRTPAHSNSKLVKIKTTSNPKKTTKTNG